MNHSKQGKVLKQSFMLSTIAVSCALAFNAQAAMDCSTLETWDSNTAYTGGAQVQEANKVYKANWWTKGNNPASHSGAHQEWSFVDDCGNGGTNQLPTVAITSPSSSDSIITGDVVAITANAADADGTVAKVEFYVGATLLATITQAPYVTNWTAVTGNQAIKAIAFDDKGATAESVTTVNVTDTSNTVPTTAVTLSANSVTLGDVVTFTATAADTDGTVAKVDFYVDGSLVGTTATAPYTLAYTTTKAGSLNVFTRATDDLGATGDSAIVSLTVNNGAVVNNCRPDGLYQTEGVNVPYCTIYDQDGREQMGVDHPRRVIGYFTSWRAGDDPQAQYLVKDIPWEQLTHINYAFVSIGSDGKVNVGDVTDPANAATGKEWPGVEIDPTLGFKGHFGALATYKKKHDVKTLISIGGWAETGGHFGVDGKRIADGGFYTMTTNADGSINHAGIETFATSAVEMLRKYQFDGLDIDYEYPTSMAGAGNPDDKAFMESRRAYLWASYQELMKVLRQKLDNASAQDGTHYMLTIAAPSSGYLLRGMETFDVTKYLDYVNIMSYDLHGAWNDHVGHNAALYDTGKDSELAMWNVYNTAAYGGIGYLNTDWAYHYFRGSMPAGRINIGVPYYTRGWQGVTGGENGLWGRAALPNQAECGPGTGEGEKNNCGNGALGIDNMWHDLNSAGNEMGAGSNPMWHAMNLAQGIYGTYTAAYGLDPINDPQDKLVGSYTRNYDSVAVAPWLWNAEKKVFLSTEDKDSINVKADYVIDKGIGGIMFWELAGDYNCYVLDANGNRAGVDVSEMSCKNGNGEYHMGNTMTNAMYEKFKSATPYGNKVATGAIPTEALDIAISVGGFKVGDQNYPINPKITFTNNTGHALPGGTEFQFDIPTSAPDNAKDQSGGGLKVIASGHTQANNIGGLTGEMHRVAFTLPSWKELPAGGTYELDMVYYLPISGPANYAVTVNGKEYAFKFEQPDLPLGDISGGNNGGGDNGGGTCSTTGLNVYPNWPQTDWGGNPSHANQGDKIIHNGVVYKANWWTSAVPGTGGSWTTVCSVK
ncbi:chitinase C-terminal domain-containing protein [Photobacterium sanguinicancri]|uniref:Glycosyl hydrolase family 18 protein n=1 Tax=Photobacterium sanguinicancri TaxID=875932 RepID=A0AAW7Y6A5_9GAMM|nr:glycosyl hydrolase family 18 protein [Photobacterium sanguinicancri]MDO6542284.1 glycosyl hydrolase family 18 protein [Photobacterium sanguinicancri]